MEIFINDECGKPLSNVVFSDKVGIDKTKKKERERGSEKGK